MLIDILIPEEKTRMDEQKQAPETSKNVDRRAIVKKAAYIVPAVLAAVVASERPAYAAPSGAPSPS